MSTQRRKLPHFVLIAVGVLSIIAVLGLAFVYQVERFMTLWGSCTPIVQERKESSDGRYIAVVFSMECISTAPFNTQLSIVKRNGSFSPTQHRAFLVLGGRHQLELSWTDANVLVVRVPASARTFKQEQPENSVRVKYQ
jgi:hypothetical protein